jgi:hypothetical protein
MRLGTYTGHDDVGPDQIIRVADDVSGVTVTLSDGRREWLTLYSDPTHTGVGLAALVLSTRPRHPQDRPCGPLGRAATRSPVARLMRDSDSRACHPPCGGVTHSSAAGSGLAASMHGLSLLHKALAAKQIQVHGGDRIENDEHQAVLG